MIGFQRKAIRKRRKCLKDGVNAEEKVVCSEKTNFAKLEKFSKSKSLLL